MITRRRLATAALALPFVNSARAAAPLRLRVSLDTASTHGRNVAFADFLAKLEAASNGEIRGEIFSSGALFADRDVAKALLQGQADMAAPGTWILAAFVPDTEIFQLPVLYGASIETVHRITDGHIGAMIGDTIQQKLKMHVAGPWLDLGFNNWYSTRKKLARIEDLKGMKIRNSGGAGQAWRAKFQGAVPNATAWPDVPLALTQNTFDGLASTNESVASAKLWEAGVRYALEDHQFMAVYIPVISDSFWNKLSPPQQALVTRVWAENIPAWRANMAAAQDRARQTLLDHNVLIAVPTQAETDAVRRSMLADEDALARELKISSPVMAALHAELGA